MQGGGYLCGLFVVFPKEEVYMRKNKLFKFLIAAVFLFGAICVHAESNSIGSVTLKLGNATAISSNGEIRPLKAGDNVFQHEIIKTGKSGHVHIRFIDNALVSVRPNSRLNIITYQFDAKNPKASTIQFKLEEGVVRSISGEGAQAAKERFRLNTPIAAIGVRGTDFFATAVNDRVSVLVNEGAVVVAPFSSDCDIAGFGPCIADAMELKGGTDQFIEVTSVEMTPKLRSAKEDALMNGLLQEMGLKSSSLLNKSDVSTIDVGDAGEATDISLQGEILKSSGLEKRQLVWGRWSGAVSPSDKVVVANELINKSTKRLTVGNADFFLMAPLEMSDFSSTDLGYVQFALAGGQAEFSSAAYVEKMAFSRATLAVDFASDTFATQLDLKGSQTGNVALNLTGIINDAGNFSARTKKEFVVGSVSPDASEAAYAFRKDVGQGNVSGLTIWNQPN